MEKKRKKKWIYITAIVLAVLFVIYWIAVYFLVSAALVPSFMNKLDAFESITEESYSKQVQSNDIIENEEKELLLTKRWLKETFAQKIRVTSKDGYTLVACQFLQPELNDKWVLLLHGYTGWKEEMFPYAYWYYQQGFNVLVPDLRCQGESGGDFIGMGYTDSEDCMIWLQHILEENRNAKIVIHGESMGASTALMMTGKEELSSHVKMVISDCAYTDAYSMFGYKCKEWFHLPPFPLVDSACLMLKLRGGYNLKKASALEAVKNSKTPTIFIHGDEDAIINVKMVKELYENAACPKKLLIVEGAGHAQSKEKAPEEYYGAIQEFMELYMK